MNRFLNYGNQWIDQDDREAVVSALASDHLTQGPRIQEFERALCSYTGAQYCVVVSNATAGLQLAVAALEIEAGSEGITSPNTFVASANALVYNKIKPVFADIEESSYNIDPKEIVARLNEKTRLLIPVHFAGRVCDMKTINRIARDNNLFVIEDAAHAIGSRCDNDGNVGKCLYSDMTVFSFHPVKNITTGEGGAVTTNNRELYEKLLLLRSHGITKDMDLLSDNPGPWYYEMQTLGYNYRMTDLQAALGISQLSKIDGYKARRNEIIHQYNSAFAATPWLKTPLPDREDSCFHLYVVQIEFEQLGLSRKVVMERLREKGIGTQVHYIPVHVQPYYRREFGYSWGNYPKAERYYERALSLPLYPKMNDEDVGRVISAVRQLRG